MAVAAKANGKATNRLPKESSERVELKSIDIREFTIPIRQAERTEEAASRCQGVISNREPGFGPVFCCAVHI